MKHLIAHTWYWRLRIFTAARYVAYTTLLAYHGWLTEIKDRWGELTSWDLCNIACIMSLAALVAIGAVTNKDWHETPSGPKPPTS